MIRRLVQAWGALTTAYFGTRQQKKILVRSGLMCILFRRGCQDTMEGQIDPTSDWVKVGADTGVETGNLR